MIGEANAVWTLLLQIVAVILAAVVKLQAFKIRRLEDRVEENSRLIAKTISVLTAMSSTDEALYRTVARAFGK